MHAASAQRLYIAACFNVSISTPVSLRRKNEKFPTHLVCVVLDAAAQIKGFYSHCGRICAPFVDGWYATQKRFCSPARSLTALQISTVRLKIPQSTQRVHKSS